MAIFSNKGKTIGGKGKKTIRTAFKKWRSPHSTMTNIRRMSFVAISKEKALHVRQKKISRVGNDAGTTVNPGAEFDPGVGIGAGAGTGIVGNSEDTTPSNTHAISVTSTPLAMALSVPSNNSSTNMAALTLSDTVHVSKPQKNNRRKGYCVKICVRPPNVPIILNCLRDRKKYGPRPVENNDPHYDVNGVAMVPDAVDSSIGEGSGMVVDSDDEIAAGDDIDEQSHLRTYVCHGKYVTEVGVGQTTMIVKSVDRDGNCCFESVVRQLAGCSYSFPDVPTSQQELRNQCVQWLRDNIDEPYGGEDTGREDNGVTIRQVLEATILGLDDDHIQTNEDYFGRMLMFQYGSSMEIMAVAQLFKVSVTCVENDDNTDRGNNPNSNRPIFNNINNPQVAVNPTVYKYQGSDHTGQHLYLYHTNRTHHDTHGHLEHFDELVSIDCFLASQQANTTRLWEPRDVYRNVHGSDASPDDGGGEKQSPRLTVLEEDLRCVTLVEDYIDNEYINIAESITVKNPSVASVDGDLKVGIEEVVVDTNANIRLTAVDENSITRKITPRKKSKLSFTERVAKDIEDRRPKKLLISDCPHTTLNVEQQKMADLGFSLQMAMDACCVIHGDEPREESPRAAAIRLIKKHLQVLLNCDLNTLTTADALEIAIAFRKELCDQINIYAPSLRERLNLGSFPDPDIFGIIMMNWCTPSCIDFVDPKEIDPATRANHAADTNSCVRLVKYTILGSNLRQAQAQRLDKIEDEASKKLEEERLDSEYKRLKEKIPHTIAVIDRLWMVPYTKESYLQEINKMTAMAGFDDKLAPYVSQILVAFQSVLSAVHHKRQTPILACGGDVRKKMRGTVPPRSEHATVVDAGCIAHPENFVNTARLKNRLIFPPQKVRFYDKLFTNFYSHNDAVNDFISGEKCNSLERLAGLASCDNDFTETDFAELRSVMRLFGGDNMSEKQRMAVYDPKFRATFLRLFGDKDMSEKQRICFYDPKYKGKLGSDSMSEGQIKCMIIPLALPISGKHATARERMGPPSAKKGIPKYCFICQYTMFMVPEFREQCNDVFIDYHRRNEGLSSKERQLPRNYVCEQTYSNGKKMLYQPAGGCNKCKVWVCEDHWLDFDHNDAHKYIEFVSSMPNYSIFGQQLLYVGQCKSCGHDKYSTSRNKYQRCSFCSTSARGEMYLKTSVTIGIRSKQNETFLERKRKVCKCLLDCECTE